MHSARQVIGCHFTQLTRFQNAFGDVAIPASCSPYLALLQASGTPMATIILFLIGFDTSVPGAYTRSLSGST